MNGLVETTVSNAIVATLLAILVAATGRFWRRPAVLHTMWLVVVAKLLTPPFFSIPIPLPRADVAETVFVTAHAPSGMQPPEAVASAASLFADVDLATTLLVIWGAGSIICVVVTVCRVRRFWILLARAEPAPEGWLREAQSVSRALGLPACPKIVMLPARISPVVWSLTWKPLVVLPQKLFSSFDGKSRAAILAHELAHVRRGDHRVRIFEIIATCVFWWHPVLWWARKELHEMEEQCCDIEVLRVLPNATRSYAVALVDTLDYLQGTRLVLPATTGARPSTSLQRRIELLMKGQVVKRTTTLQAFVVAVLAALTLPTVFVQAQDENKHAGQSAKRHVVVESPDGNIAGHYLFVDSEHKDDYIIVNLDGKQMKFRVVEEISEPVVTTTKAKVTVKSEKDVFVVVDDAKVGTWEDKSGKAGSFFRVEYDRTAPRWEREVVVDPKDGDNLFWFRAGESSGKSSDHKKPISGDRDLFEYKKTNNDLAWLEREGGAGDAQSHDRVLKKKKRFTVQAHSDKHGNLFITRAKSDEGQVNEETIRSLQQELAKLRKEVDELKKRK